MEEEPQSLEVTVGRAAAALLGLLREISTELPWGDEHPLNICRRGVQMVLASMQDTFTYADEKSCEDYCQILVDKKLGQVKYTDSSKSNEGSVADLSGWWEEPFIDGAISLLHLFLQRQSEHWDISCAMMETALAISQILLLLSTSKCGHKCLCDLSAGTRLNAEVRRLLKYGILTSSGDGDDTLEALTEELTTALTAAVSNILSALPPEVERTVSLVTLQDELQKAELSGEPFPLCICNRLRGRQYIDIAKAAGRKADRGATVLQVCARQLRDTDAGVGALIWPSSLIAARSSVCSSEPSWKSYSWVLELGAGIGLAGLACAMQGRAEWVVLTDYHETLLANLRHNVKISEVQCRGLGGHHAHVAVSLLDWSIPPQNLITLADPTQQHCVVCGEKASANNTKPGYDLIIGADVVYDEILGPMVAKVLSTLLTPQSLGIVFTPSSRQGVPTFRDELMNMHSVHFLEDDVHDCMYMDTNVFAQNSSRHTYKRFLVMTKSA